MINPYGMTLTDWADSVILSAGDAWAFGRLQDESRWQDWAVAFLRGSYSQTNAPDPYAFTDWREWAMRAYTMLERNV
jgi:hypothetical protein